jgi:hypothetical protein
MPPKHNNNKKKTKLERQTVIPALRRLKKKDHEFKDNLQYAVRLCLKKKKLAASK